MQFIGAFAKVWKELGLLDLVHSNKVYRIAMICIFFLKILITSLTCHVATDHRSPCLITYSCVIHDIVLMMLQDLLIIVYMILEISCLLQTCFRFSLSCLFDQILCIITLYHITHVHQAVNHHMFIILKTWSSLSIYELWYVYHIIKYKMFTLAMSFLSYCELWHVYNTISYPIYIIL